MRESPEKARSCSDGLPISRCLFVYLNESNGMNGYRAKVYVRFLKKRMEVDASMGSEKQNGYRLYKKD
jgi:hypothetical protein